MQSAAELKPATGPAPDYHTRAHTLGPQRSVWGRASLRLQ